MEVGNVNGVAGGSRYVGDDGAPVLKDGVDQGGFARIGTAYDGHLDGRGRFRVFHRSFLHFFFQGRACLLEEGVQSGGQFREAPAMGGGEEDVVIKTESGEFTQVEVLFFVVSLVEKQHDRYFRFAEMVRDALVNRGEVVPAV